MDSRILSEREGDVATEALETRSTKCLRPIAGEIRALETRRSNQLGCGCVSGYRQIVVGFRGMVCFSLPANSAGKGSAGVNMVWFAGVIQKFSPEGFSGVARWDSAFADGSCLCCVMYFVMLLTSCTHLHLCRSDKRPVLLPSLM